MSNISKITLPINGSYQTFDIVDSKARDIIKTSQPLIIGTQNTSTSMWKGRAPFDSLLDEQKIIFYLPYDSTSNNVTLNLTLSDGTTKTGDLPCYTKGSSRLTTQYGAGHFVTLIYKRNVNYANSSYTGWWIYADSDSDTSSYLQINNNKVKAGTNGINGNQLIMQTGPDTWESLTTSYDMGISKTKNSKGFYLSNILYHNSNQIVRSGNYTGTWRIMEQNSTIDFRYSSNCGTNLIADKPVYIVGTINNGLFYLDDTWWSQDLPTSDDNKIYIYLGIAYSQSFISKFAYNPIFWFNNGYIEIYNGIRNKKENTTKAYILGITANPEDSDKQIYDDNIYTTEVAGQLNVKSLQIDKKSIIIYNSNSESLDFLF